MNKIDRILYDLEKHNNELSQKMAKTIKTIGNREQMHQDVDDTPTTTMTTEIKATNPKDACGIKKVPLSGMPAPVLLEAGLVKLHGDLKYGRYNWREAGVRGSVYYDAAFRHLAAWYEGEDTDPDSGISHLAHAITGLAVLRDSIMRGNWVDDRPQSTQGFIAEMNKKAAEMVEQHNNK